MKSPRCSKLSLSLCNNLSEPLTSLVNKQRFHDRVEAAQNVGQTGHLLGRNVCERNEQFEMHIDFL